MTEHRVLNFGAGPAALPESVLKQAQQELLNFQDTGMSIMELSHRSKVFMKVVNDAKRDLIDLMEIPDNYEVIFMQGGATTGFSAVVYNLLAAKKRTDPHGKAPVDYFITGGWSSKAAAEAKRLGANVNVVVDTKKSTGAYTSVPPPEEWTGHLSGSDAAYVYYCDNETVHGVEFPYIPEVDPSVPLVADMSSNFLSRKVDVSKFGVIYGGAQKNVGPAGVTIVIVRKDLLTDLTSYQDTPSGAFVIPQMLDYKTLVDNNSLYNTPPMFSIYIVGLVLQHLKSLGGLEAIEAMNKRKSDKIYGIIAKSALYKCLVQEGSRSRMNIVFRLDSEEREKAFLKGAEERNMVQLNGHRSVGGIRVSLYNAVTEEAVETLAAYMMDFEKDTTQ
ncbi:hypothetical protein BZG36_00812 [Bifiguratus adelaidae]|uniref:Phosphoserine aminotransferase n=1 Tax=Bifiguratus adelaidae TaxID=1938954 RepID=A0A261Y6L6_9FUNG|nr:hypothetical protein BZG36_00812 [Bifiguratus adelaidae]